MAKRFEIFTVFKGIDKVTGPMKKISEVSGKFASRMKRPLEGMKKMNDGVDRAGRAVLAGSAVVGAGLAGVIKKGAEFEQTMINAAVKFPGEIRKGTPAFEQLAKVASDIGANTEFSATEAAQGLDFLAMAGFNAEQAMAAMPGLVDMATAGALNLATASDIASDALGAFGLASTDAAVNAQQLQRVSDVFVKTSHRANTTVELLWDTLQKAGPVAQMTGASLEETAAIAGQLANAGLKGAEAGTAMKNVMLSIAKPSDAAAKIFDKYGIALRNADGSARKITDVMGELGTKVPQMDQAAVFTEIFGREAVVGAKNVSALAQGVNALQGELEGAVGYSEGVAKVMRDSMQGRIKSLQSVAEAFVIDLFGNSEGEFAKAIDQATAWMRENGAPMARKFGEAIKWVADNFGMLVSIGKQLVVVAAAIKITSAAMGIMNALANANPWVLLIAALVTGAMLIIANWDAVKAWFVSMWEWVKENWVQIGRALLLPFTALPQAIYAIITNWDALVAGFLVGIDAIKSALMAVGEAISGFFGGIWDGLVSGARSAWATMLELAVSMLEKINGVYKQLAPILPGVNGGELDATIKHVQGMAVQARADSEVAKSELTIRDETQRAVVSAGKLAPGIKLQKTGAT